MLGHDRHLVTLPPHLQLLHRGGAEGIAGGQHHRLALVLEAARQFADGGGLPRAVDAHHQDHPRLARRGRGLRALTALQGLLQFLLELGAEGRGVGQLLTPDPAGDVIDDAGGGVHPHVGG